MLNLLEVNVPWGGRRGSRGRLPRRGRRLARAKPRLELFDSIRERLAREVGTGARHLHEGELERQARVASLAHVFNRDGKQIDEPQHVGLAELIRLRAQPLARLWCD